MIKLYTADIGTIKKADYIAEYNLLSDFKKKKISELKIDAAKMRSLAALILLRKGINELYGVNDYNISYSASGKPELPFCSFSISHSRDLAVCAISDSPIGVDAQHLKSNIPKLPIRFFSKEENSYIHSSPDRATAFFELWTKKEAYIKLTGSNLAAGLKVNVLKLEDIGFNTAVSGDYIITTAYSKLGIKSDILGG